MRRRGPARSYKLLSVLLRYPDERTVAGLPELEGAVAGLPSGPERRALEQFLAYLGSLPQVELAQRYVETFDLRRRTSLYLSYPVHGDTRRRGVALVRLKRLYAAAGLELAAGPLGQGELPDYLPLVLEFAALAPAELGETVLREHRPSLELLRAGLHDADSPYALLLDVLVAGLPRLTALERERVRKLAAEGPPSEEVGLQPFAPPEVMPGARV